MMYSMKTANKNTIRECARSNVKAWMQAISRRVHPDSGDPCVFDEKCYFKHEALAHMRIITADAAKAADKYSEYYTRGLLYWGPDNGSGLPIRLCEEDKSFFEELLEDKVPFSGDMMLVASTDAPSAEAPTDKKDNSHAPTDKQASMLGSNNNFTGACEARAVKACSNVTKQDKLTLMQAKLRAVFAFYKEKPRSKKYLPRKASEVRKYCRELKRQREKKEEEEAAKGTAQHKNTDDPCGA